MLHYYLCKCQDIHQHLFKKLLTGKQDKKQKIATNEKDKTKTQSKQNDKGKNLQWLKMFLKKTNLCNDSGLSQKLATLLCNGICMKC